MSNVVDMRAQLASAALPSPVLTASGCAAAGRGVCNANAQSGLAETGTKNGFRQEEIYEYQAVSYTHLTLPTIYPV